MEQWLAKTFAAAPGGLRVHSDSNRDVVIDPAAATAGGGIFASIGATPPSHATLSALPCAAQGWQAVFDQWKADGLVA